jgi:putative membrane protein
MRLLSLAGLIGGFALAAWLVTRVGVPAIGAALGAIGWAGLLAVVAVHLVAVALMGLAWWNQRRLGRPAIFMWGRLVRDAGSEVLPLTQLGGCLLAAQVLIAEGIAGATATASILVDAILEFLAQLAYLALGLVLMQRLAPNAPVLPALSAMLAIALTLAGAAALARRGGPAGMPRLGNLLVGRLVGRWLSAAARMAATVRAEIAEIQRARHRLALSFLLHFAAWLVSGLEAWLALRIMGAPLDLTAVLAIESLVYGTRSLAFLVPNAIGIQDGAYVILGTALGLTPELALSLSLLKRGRDLTLGLPTLAIWHLLRSRRWAGLGRSEA